MIRVSTRKAYAVSPRAVVVRDGALFIKCEREGNDFVQHFLVACDPRPEGESMLIYLDPEDDLDAFPVGADFALGEPGQGPAAFGDIIKTPKGVFLKVREDRRTDAEKLAVFIDLNTGLVKRRQERKVEAVFPDWRIDSVGGAAPEDARSTT